MLARYPHLPGICLFYIELCHQVKPFKHPMIKRPCGRKRVSVSTHFVQIRRQVGVGLKTRCQVRPQGRPKYNLNFFVSSTYISHTKIRWLKDFVGSGTSKKTPCMNIKKLCQLESLDQYWLEVSGHLSWLDLYRAQEGGMVLSRRRKLRSYYPARGIKPCRPPHHNAI